jgi:hypothetical protein
MSRLKEIGPAACSEAAEAIRMGRRTRRFIEAGG